MKECFLLIFLSFLLKQTTTIELLFQPGHSICTGLMSSFDPIKIDISLPDIPQRIDNEVFKIVITSLKTTQNVYQFNITPGSVLRKSIDLDPSIVHQMCISLQSERIFPENQSPIYIPYTQTEDFQKLIGHIEIPEELAKEESLKQIYTVSTKIINMNKIIDSHQNKERALEDKIATKSLHKTERIISIGLLECLVIMLSGVYQVFALRKFLIEKNIY